MRCLRYEGFELTGLLGEKGNQGFLRADIWILEIDFFGVC